MIKASELRIGNWFLEFGIPTQADGRFIDRLQNIEIRNKIAIDVSPIPLTPEILEKCGFDKWNSPSVNLHIDAWQDDQSSARFDIDWIDGKLYLKSRYEIENLPFQWMPNIKYLHQLQNLYYALTGEELNYTP